MFRFLKEFFTMKPHVSIQQSPAKLQPIDYVFEYEIDDSSLRYQLALDSGMTIVSSKNGLTTFHADMHCNAEYINYCTVNSKALYNELRDRYKV